MPFLQEPVLKHIRNSALGDILYSSHRVGFSIRRFQNVYGGNYTIMALSFFLLLCNAMSKVVISVPLSLKVSN